MEKQAIKIAAIAIGILALSMVVYYKFFRAHIDEEISLTQKVEVSKDSKSIYEGVYSPAESIEADGRRISYLTISKLDEANFVGAWKIEKIGESESAVIDCSETKISSKEFFLRCSNPSYGNISYDAMIQNSDSGINVAGKFLWTNQSNVVLEKNIVFTHAPGE